MNKLRVLIVEDHYVTRHLLERTIASHGAKVTAVGTAEEALKAAGPDKFDVILLDRVMPDADGVEVCTKIKSDRAHPVHIILVTGLGSKADIATGLAAGADDYVIKPVDPDELMARVMVGYRAVRLQRQVLALGGNVEEAYNINLRRSK